MMNNREIAEHIIGLSLDMSMHDVESIERIEKALDIKDDHATEVQTKLLTQITTLRGALVKAEQFIDNGIELGYIHLPDPEIGDTATDTPKVIREALAVLVTSKDTEGIGSDQGNILASAVGNEAAPSGPMFVLDCSKINSMQIEDIKRIIELRPRTTDIHTRKDAIERVFEGDWIKLLEYRDRLESSLSDNERVMDLIRAVKKWQEEWDCPPDGWHGASVATESALYTLAKSLPPHIIELARKGDW